MSLTHKQTETENRELRGKTLVQTDNYKSVDEQNAKQF